MANWYGMGRTNYVKVTDRAALDAWLESLSIDTVDIYEKEDGRIALSGYQSEDGDLPSFYEDQDGNEREDFLYDFASRFLADGEVLVVQTVGHEKARYASGYARALNNRGEDVFVSIDDIYALAAEKFGVERSAISEASY